MSFRIAAERLAHEWALGQDIAPRERDERVASHILRQLADPESDYGPLLDHLCRVRWPLDREVS